VPRRRLLPTRAKQRVMFSSLSSSTHLPQVPSTLLVFQPFLFQLFLLLSSTFIQDFNCTNCNLAFSDNTYYRRTTAEAAPRAGGQRLPQEPATYLPTYRHRLFFAGFFSVSKL
jgi:hypothetical protein